MLLLAPVVFFVGANTALETHYVRRFPTMTTTTMRDLAGADLAATYFPSTYWVFFPGFGIDFGTDVETAYADLIHQTGQSFTVSPSRSRLDIAEIAGRVRQRVKTNGQTDEQRVHLRFYGISMGGILAYEVARHLDRTESDVVVDAIIFDSSPAGRQDVSGVKQYAVAVGSLLNRMPSLPWGVPNPLEGGPLDRFLTQQAGASWARVSHGEGPVVEEDVLLSWHKATSVTSGSLTRQLDLIDSFVPAPDPYTLKDTRFAYFGAKETLMDTTVDVGSAVESYRRLVAPRELRVFRIEGGHHASANETVEPYRRALASFVAEAGYPTVDEVRADRMAHSRVPVGP